MAAYLDIGEELPDAVAGDNEVLALVVNVDHLNFWLADDADVPALRVAEAPAHGQAGLVLALLPHAEGAGFLVLPALHSLHASSRLHDADALSGAVRLVVVGYWDAVPIIGCGLLGENGPRVSHIRAEELVVFDEDRDIRGAAELAVDRPMEQVLRGQLVGLIDAVNVILIGQVLLQLLLLLHALRDVLRNLLANVFGNLVTIFTCPRQNSQKKKLRGTAAQSPPSRARRIP